MRIAVIGDSISSRNNGASAVSWPFLLGTMIRDGGVFDIEVRNYSLPGLTWRTARVPTAGWLIGQNKSPVEAAYYDSDMVLVCLGVNDRHNQNALQDALEFRDSLPHVPVHLARQILHGNSAPDATSVSESDQMGMNAVYDSLSIPGFNCNMWMAYDCGYTFDKLHPTDTGKHWISCAVYMYLQQYLPITPIARNIAWLHWVRNVAPEAYKQMLEVPK